MRCMSSTTAPRRAVPSDGLTLRHFLGETDTTDSETIMPEALTPPVIGFDELTVDDTSSLPTRHTYYMETYGCQMNESDSQIVHSVLRSAGLSAVDDIADAQVVLINTCAIRESAEQKVWSRLEYFRSVRRRKSAAARPLVAVLGCMAERLKTRLLDADKLVDIVVGPDAYRSLPDMIRAADMGETAVNVQLSLDETYADIAPVRTSSNGLSAYVSIMRGCDNMCSYCIVPYTRGRERSRDADSIVDEVRALSDSGVKEVTLLGQNVNSYNFTTQRQLAPTKAAATAGFVNISRRPLIGVGFTELLDRVSLVNPEMRIRFTSPHPKDFPDDLIHLIGERNNICKSIHIPAQSGSTAVLSRMRRGYTRESYMQLVDKIRRIIPNCALTTDLISGFCGESEDDHAQTLSLLSEVRYDQAYMFAYSQRERTHAHRTLADDVAADVKRRRLREVIDTFHRIAAEVNVGRVGDIALVLVEGRSKKSASDLAGRTDTNRTAVFPAVPLHVASLNGAGGERVPVPGDFVAVEILPSQFAYRCRALCVTTIASFEAESPQERMEKTWAELCQSPLDHLLTSSH